MENYSNDGVWDTNLLRQEQRIPCVECRSKGEHLLSCSLLHDAYVPLWYRNLKKQHGLLVRCHQCDMPDGQHRAYCKSSMWSREVARLKAIKEQEDERKYVPMSDEIAEARFSADDVNILQADLDLLEALEHTTVSESVAEQCRKEIEMGRKSGWRA